MDKSRSFLTMYILALASSGLFAQQMKYPPLSRYLIPQEKEISLAKSAAPASISDRATIKVLTKEGYKTTREGDNGFVCFVMRGYTDAPNFTPIPVRAAIAYDPNTLAPIWP